MAPEGPHINFEVIEEVSSGVSFNNGFLFRAIGKLSSEVFASSVGPALYDEIGAEKRVRAWLKNYRYWLKSVHQVW